jgi:hypothetical protein
MKQSKNGNILIKSSISLADSAEEEFNRLKIFLISKHVIKQTAFNFKLNLNEREINKRNKEIKDMIDSWIE